jgi:phosphoglycerate dehydrogenase-like enzyme
VFDVEPLPTDHPFRRLDNVVLTPHLGYVSQQSYERYYPDIVENIRGFLDGKPVRVIAPKWGAVRKAPHIGGGTML